MLKNKFVISICVALTISLLANTILGFLYVKQLKDFKHLSHVNQMVSAIHSSDNTMQVLSFYKNQLEMETISQNDYSLQLKELSDIHVSLISLLSNQDFTVDNPLKEKVLLFLNERKKIFDNLKSAIDLDSSNYYNIATAAEEEANSLLNEINTELVEQKKKG